MSFAEALRPFREDPGAPPPPPSPRPPLASASAASAPDSGRVAPVVRPATLPVPTRVYVVASIAAVFAALVALGIVGLLARDDGTPSASGTAGPETTSERGPSGGDTTSPPADHPDRAAADPGPDAASADDAAGPAPAEATPDASPPIDVAGDEADGKPPARVVLEGLPPEATATLDGRPVGNVFEIEASETPRRLEIVARGWKTWRRELRIAADLTLQVHMERRDPGVGPLDAGTAPGPADAEAGAPPVDAATDAAPVDAGATVETPDVEEPPPPREVGAGAPQDGGAAEDLVFAPNPFGSDS
jgi:hypothetical protein